MIRELLLRPGVTAEEVGLAAGLSPGQCRTLGGLQLTIEGGAVTLDAKQLDGSSIRYVSTPTGWSWAWVRTEVVEVKPVK